MEFILVIENQNPTMQQEILVSFLNFYNISVNLHTSFRIFRYGCPSSGQISQKHLRLCVFAGAKFFRSENDTTLEVEQNGIQALQPGRDRAEMAKVLG